MICPSKKCLTFGVHIKSLSYSVLYLGYTAGLPRVRVVPQMSVHVGEARRVPLLLFGARSRVQCTCRCTACNTVCAFCRGGKIGSCRRGCPRFCLHDHAPAMPAVYLRQINDRPKKRSASCRQAADQRKNGECARGIKEALDHAEQTLAYGSFGNSDFHAVSSFRVLCFLFTCIVYPHVCTIKRTSKICFCQKNRRYLAFCPNLE